MTQTGGALAQIQRGGPELFLFKAVSRMEPTAAETFWRQLTQAASKRLFRTVMKDPSPSGRAQALFDTARAASLGLERAAEGEMERAARLAAEIGAAKLARAGTEILTRLEQMAEETETSLQMPPPNEDRSYLNAVEQHRLGQLLKGLIAYRSLPPDMRPLDAPRPVASMADARFALEALLCFEARAFLFRAFPQGRLREALCRVMEADEAVDQALMNGALNPAAGIDFEAGEEAHAQLQAMGLETARARLLDWIEQLLEGLQAEEETKERIRRYLEYRAERLSMSAEARPIPP